MKTQAGVSRTYLRTPPSPSRAERAPELSASCGEVSVCRHGSPLVESQEATPPAWGLGLVRNFALEARRDLCRKGAFLTPRARFQSPLEIEGNPHRDRRILRHVCRMPHSAYIGKFSPYGGNYPD